MLPELKPPRPDERGPRERERRRGLDRRAEERHHVGALEADPVGLHVKAALRPQYRELEVAIGVGSGQKIGDYGEGGAAVVGREAGDRVDGVSSGAGVCLRDKSWEKEDERRESENDV